MSIKKASNITGAPAEWSRRKRNARRALLATIFLAVVATGASLLFLKSSRKPAVVERNHPASPGARMPAVDPAVAAPLNSQTAKSTAPAAQRLSDNGAEKTEGSASDKLISSRMRELAKTAKLKLLEHKRRALKRAERSSTTVLTASEGVFRPSPPTLAPLSTEKTPVFSILKDSKERNHQATASAATDSTPAQAALGQESLPQKSDAAMSNKVGGSPSEPRIEAAIDPQTKLPAEKRMLTSLTGSGIDSTVPVPGNTSAQGQQAQSQVKQSGLPPGIDGIAQGIETVIPGEFNGDVRFLPQVPSAPRAEFKKERPPNTKEPPSKELGPDLPNSSPLAPMPSPIQNFAGLSFSTAVTGGTAGGGWPPDINGDVGPNHYIQGVNTAWGIYSKTGTLLAAFTENSLWSGSGIGTPCNANNQGDPVVVYDQFADRWYLTNFAFATSGSPNFTPVAPFYQCIAVSKTSDPVAGGWWLYAIKMDTGVAGQPPAGTLSDYPHFGNWNDGCLYLGANGFLAPAFSFNGTIFASFSKSAMMSGAALTASNSALGFIANASNPFTLIPSNISGAKGSATSLPPAGTPNYFVSQSQPLFAFEVRKFTPGANCGSGGTLGAATNVGQTPYGLSFGDVVPQPPPATAAHDLDSLDDRVMQKAQYRRVGAVESLWVTHTTRTSGQTARPQWAQINVSGGIVAAVTVQQQIFAPDTTLNRWMGSIAADHVGNVAMGYSTSNGTAPNFPSIAYAGRLVTDPLNDLPQSEVQLIAGTGSQTTAGGTPIHRWGDYTAMSIDPVDDCTFWYTNQYYTTSGFDWRTRVGSFKFPNCSTPTVAKVTSFTADGFDGGRVLLRWSSSQELDNLGYNVYREANGRRTKINPQTIAGSALVTGPKVALTAGKSYVWADQLTQGGARYWLEDIDLSGKSTWTGPVNLNTKGGKAPSVEDSVLLTRIGFASAQMTLGQGSVQVERKAEIASPTPAAIEQQTDLAGQPAVKLSVKQEAWYRVSQQDLVAAGLSTTADARNLQLYVDGRQVPMVVNGESDGKLDPSDSVEFYGVGLNSAVTNTRVYWLVAGTQPGARINSTKTDGSQNAPGSYTTAVERKDRTIYFSGLRNGEAENFFGPVVGGTSVDQSVTLTKLASISAPAALEVFLQGVTLTSHQVRVTLNGAVVGTVSFSGQERGKASFPVPQSSLHEGLNTVQLVALGGPSDISLADTVRVQYAHTLTADSNLLRPATKAGQPVTIGGFTSPDVRVIDVTDAYDPKELTGTVSGPVNNSNISLTPPGVGTRMLLAFTGARVLTPAAKANIPSNWHEDGLQHDYVMITTGELKSSLLPLKALREGQGMSVVVVDVEDLYDEFSFGIKSPKAIKDFLQFTRDSWRQVPRFVLLAGDSSYDPKNYLGYGEFDLVPTKLYDSAYMEAASDDWFVDFQGTGLPAIASGRLPVRNVAEATAMVGKIVSYESSTGSNSLLMSWDLDDGYNFAAFGNTLRPLVPGGMQLVEVARGAVDDATAKSQVLAAINQGKTIVNYNGHGSVNQWRANILTNADAAGMTNSQKLAFFVMMTCLNGYYNDPVLDSLAESLMKSIGGAAAVWASSAQCEPGGQEQMNAELYRLLFSGEPITVGEATQRAKQAVTDSDVRRSWILFGDPAMRLK
jgi:hypothetical protein